MHFFIKGGGNIAKLTEKQTRFCEEYLVDLNATQAAIRAGYSEKSASRISIELLNKTHVAKYISELRKKQSKRTEITADRVLEELAAIAFSDRTEIAKINARGRVIFTPTDDLSPTAKKTITAIKDGRYGAEISCCDKLKALELIGKHLGMFEAPEEGEETEDTSDIEEALANVPDE